ncbi:hypothetical protein Q5752_006575 [Cryptotrichosporon argae]
MPLLPSTQRNRLLAYSLILFVTVFAILHQTRRAPAPTFAFPAEDYVYPSHPAAHAQAGPKRVAIVGAGASGSAAAFFFRRAARVAEARAGLAEGSLLELTVFEKEAYIGGRSTTVHPHSDERLYPIELGASIFVDSNRHMVKAAKLFNLSIVDPDFEDAGVGIWDGQDFLYTTSASSSRLSQWYDRLSAIRRYGPLSPYRTQAAVGALLAKFAKLYNPAWLAARGVVGSVEDFAAHAGLGNELTTRWAQDWAREAVRVGERWIAEVMEGSTRVNYASDMDGIHALGAAVSMAASGASAIAGGNWQVFANMLAYSEAAVHLETTVTEIVPVGTDDEPAFVVTSNSTAGVAREDEFDQVFFAAPWHSSPIKKSFEAHFAARIPPQKYVRLHVTLLATTARAPQPSFFRLANGAYVPTTILTTGRTARARTGMPPPRFQSITYHGETYVGSGEWVVKMFSLTRPTDRMLRAIFGDDPTWVLRKEWDSYPKLTPTASYAPVEPVRGMQYLAAMEPWVSTMETQTLAGREAVARVVNQWWGLELGECRGSADAWDWSCEP